RRLRRPTSRSAPRPTASPTCCASGSVGAREACALSGGPRGAPDYNAATLQVCDDREIRRSSRQVLSEFLDPNHTTNFINLVSLTIPKFAGDASGKVRRTSESGH